MENQQKLVVNQPYHLALEHQHCTGHSIHDRHPHYQLDFIILKIFVNTRVYTVEETRHLGSQMILGEHLI